MDALLSAFLAALLAEQGDATQLLAATIAIRFGTPWRVLAGLALAIAFGAALAAAAGAAIHLLVPHRAAQLLTALALLAAGGGSLVRAKPPKVVLYDRLGPFAAVFVAMAVLGFGDKTQFLTLGLAARSNAPVLAGIGAALGTFVGIAPALVLGPRLARVWPTVALRRTAALLFLLTGLIVLLAALRLI